GENRDDGDDLARRRQPGGRPNRRGRVREGSRLPAPQGERPRVVLGGHRAPWGFTPVAFSGLETKVRDRASYVMVQNDIRFVFTAPLTPDSDIAEHVRAHGDGVHDIAFRVADVGSAWRETTSRGAASALDPTELDGGEDGVLRRSSIRTYGETLHSFIDRRDYHGVFAPAFRRVKAPPHARQ